METVIQVLPDIGLVRISAVLKVFPVSRSAWWEGVKSGRFPQPVKLGPNTTAWKVEDIRQLIERAARGEFAGPGNSPASKPQRDR